MPIIRFYKPLELREVIGNVTIDQVRAKVRCEKCGRNVGGVPLEPATADALDSIAAEMKIGRPELIQIILREWLEANAYLPFRTIDEESETDGSA